LIIESIVINVIGTKSTGIPFEVEIDGKIDKNAKKRK
jgi:hypothetical protein